MHRLEEPVAPPQPRYEPDWLLVMQLQALYAAGHPRGSEQRAERQRHWRAAYFEALRAGLIDPA